MKHLKQLFIRLIPYLKPHLPKTIMALALSFVLAAIKGAQAYLVKPLFDQGLSENASYDKAFELALFLLLLGVLNFPARFFHFYWIRYVVDRVNCDIRFRLFQKLQRLPLSYYTNVKQGSLISQLMNDTGMFATGMRNCIDLIREPVTALVMFGLTLYRDWQLTMVMVIIAPFYVLIFNISGRKIRSNQAKVQESVSDVTHRINEGISGQKITKAFNLQRFVSSRFFKSQEYYFQTQMKTTQIEELAHPFVEFLGALGFSGVILFAHYRITSGQISTGDFVSFVTALALMMDPIRKYSQANVKLNQAMAASDRIFNLLAIEEEVDKGVNEVDDLRSSIEVKNLTFSYGEGPVIKGMNLSMNKGQKVALVGASGSGKSTLISLLQGLYPVDKGQISIDGHDINDIKLSSLRSLFGLVSQDIFLFHDSIVENLTVGDQHSLEEIKTALLTSFCLEFVEQLPQKELTLVGDRGARLSGGQKQRITIARAFLKNAPVLLFDEATSALDNQSEKVVQAALNELSKDKTVLTVAHRLSTIQHYDKIYVMKEGEVVEQGTHEELLRLQGEYFKLYSLAN